MGNPQDDLAKAPWRLTGSNTHIAVPDEDTPWYIQLVVCLAVLVGVAVLIVGGVAIVGVTAAGMVGGLPAGSSATTGSATTQTSSAPSTTSGGRHSPGSARQSRPHRKRRRSAHAITLTASPRQAPAYGRINLTGSYLAPDGTTLQVQRREARGWRDFPTTTSLNGGNFSTYIQTGHTGTNKLRVTDPGSGKVSNVVVVKVGG